MTYLHIYGDKSRKEWMDGRKRRASVVRDKYCLYVCVPGLIVPPLRNWATDEIKG